jgi:DNA-binding winged helix-turn-helix (wHTH) protein/Tfp pilus assembly protein PilF
VYVETGNAVFKKFLKAGTMGVHDNGGGRLVRLQPMLHFGDFQFDPEVPLLTRGSRSLELSPKALQILAVLVRNAGRVVSKDDLLNIVWPDALVEEGNLAVHVFALRKALGAGATTAGYIETVPKRGYRFAAPLVSVREGSTAESANPLRDRCRMAGYYVQQQTVDGCRRAAAEYRECLKTEPRNVKAKAGLANTLLFRFVLGGLNRNEAVPRAAALLEEANQIDADSADVHLSRSRLFCLGYWQWETAREELHRSLELAINDETHYTVGAWQGYYLVERGELEQGLQRLRSAHAACPLSPFISRFLAEGHFLARDFSGCAAVSRHALRLHPHSWLHYRVLGRALTALGEYGQARRYYRRATLLFNTPQTGLLAEIAYLDAVAGNRAAACNLLERLQLPPGRQHVPFVSIARIHAALGNRDRALDCLEQACVDRDWSLSALKQDSRFDSLRSAQRFRRVLTQVGI